MEKYICISFLILSTQASASDTVAQFIDDFKKAKEYQSVTRRQQSFTMQGQSPLNLQFQKISSNKDYSELLQLYNDTENSSALKQKIALKILKHPQLDSYGIINLLNIFNEDYDTQFFWPNRKSLGLVSNDRAYLEEIMNYCYTLQSIIDELYENTSKLKAHLFTEEPVAALLQIKGAIEQRTYDIGRPELVPAISKASLRKLDLIIQTFPR